MNKLSFQYVVSNKRSFYCNTIVGNKEKNYHTLPLQKRVKPTSTDWNKNKM